MSTITAEDLQAMVTHWLGCRPNGYLGSDYGSPLDDLLQTPMHGPAADRLIAKLRSDIAVMAQLPEEALSISYLEEPPDKLKLFVEVAGTLAPIAVDAVIK